MGWTLCSHTVGGPLREPLVLYVVDSIGREFPLFSRPGGPERLPNRTKCPRVRFQGTSRSSRWLVCARLCACRGPTLTGIRQPISAPWAAAASCGCPSATVADSLGFPGGPLGRRVGMVTAFGVGDDKTGRVAAAGDMLGGVAHDERATEPEPVTGALHWRAIRNDATRLPPA